MSDGRASTLAVVLMYLAGVGVAILMVEAAFR